MDPYATPDPVATPRTTRSTVMRDPTVTLPPRTYASDVVAVADPPDIQQLRWGPIVAGLLVALGTFFLLSLAAIAVGLQAAPGQKQGDIGIAAVIVTSAIALIAFFLGGYVASWSAGLTQPARSALNGFLVWASWLVVVLLMAAAGIGSLVGAMGQLFGDINLAAPDVQPQQLVDLLRSSSWQTLLALGLTAAAATLGGVLGARDDLRDRWRRPG
ncbi:MAG: hypothetical protein U0869_00310 [Chloroflexota bacterium]